LDTLSTELIRSGLDTAFIGCNLVYEHQIGSTNVEASQLARAGAPEGTLVIADYQSAGRGRLARRWLAPQGSSLLLSLVFRPEIRPSQAQRLTMICGLAAAAAVRSEFDLPIDIKWPNDLLCDGAKVGGILTELALTQHQIDFAVVGLGLNVNLDPTQLREDMLMPVTSLSHELGRSVARLPLLWAYLAEVELRYVALMAGHSPVTEWTEYLVTLGQQIRVSESGGVLEGVAEMVDAEGALLVRTMDGELRRVVAGDVTLREET
jgi:BirA family biotin operon repressor/biotin-[acetyl-CoA-carboxylase] ligase